MRELQVEGYRAHLFFFYMPSPELSIAGGAARVRRGGHDIPESTIRRRWRSGMRHFFDLYVPLADEWTVLSNANSTGPRLIAGKDAAGTTILWEPNTWEKMQTQAATNV